MALSSRPTIMVPGSTNDSSKPMPKSANSISCGSPRYSIAAPIPTVDSSVRIHLCCREIQVPANAPAVIVKTQMPPDIKLASSASPEHTPTAALVPGSVRRAASMVTPQAAMMPGLRFQGRGRRLRPIRKNAIAIIAPVLRRFFWSSASKARGLRAESSTFWAYPARSSGVSCRLNRNIAPTILRMIPGTRQRNQLCFVTQREPNMYMVTNVSRPALVSSSP